MAILGPSDLPNILKVRSEPIKQYILTMLGHPITEVELTDSQMEIVLKTSGDFIAHYFDREFRMYHFYTTPLVGTYELPSEAYWVREVSWDPSTTMIYDIFGAESYLFNIGANLGGLSSILTDYHLLQAYRKFSQRILGTEGHWEWEGEGTDADPNAPDRLRKPKIRLYPTPKGAYPVVVLYIAPIEQWRSPQAKQLTMDMMLAQSMIILGNSRSKFGSIPSPDGGSMTLNGAELVSKGHELYKEIIEKANQLGEPLMFYTY